jgi:hypothetical protein
LGSSAYCDHFGMGCSILQQLNLVAASPYDLSFMDNNSPYRHLSSVVCYPRLFERLKHEALIVGREGLVWRHLIGMPNDHGR